jgi:hypothetical protein
MPCKEDREQAKALSKRARDCDESNPIERDRPSRGFLEGTTTLRWHGTASTLIALLQLKSGMVQIKQTIKFANRMQAGTTITRSC